jgi:hypothetical protein
MDQVQCLDKLDLERTLAAFRLANTTHRGHGGISSIR